MWHKVWKYNLFQYKIIKTSINNNFWLEKDIKLKLSQYVYFINIIMQNKKNFMMTSSFQNGGGANLRRIWGPVEGQDFIFMKIWWHDYEREFFYLSEYRNRMKKFQFVQEI